MSKEVTSLNYWSLFLTLRVKYYLQILQFSTPFNEHSHSHVYLNSSTLSLINGINPILWHNHSSWSTDVFYIILTKCGANVGTSDINILLKAFARLTSHPDRENLIFYGFIYKISIWSFYIFVKASLLIRNIIKRAFQNN